MKNQADIVERGEADFAAEAVARLYSGEMTGAEELALEAWLKADPQHRRDYQRALDYWDATGDLSDDADMIAASAGNAEGPRRASRLRVPRMAAAAMLLVAIGATLFTAQWKGLWPGSQLASYQTQVGEQREVLLRDGSKITLNTDTRLLVDFTDDRRAIVMEYGEAFFDIAKDPSRPLTVKVGNRTVTVLGTQFNIHWTGPDMTVAVVEGLVSVHPNDRKTTQKLITDRRASTEPTDPPVPASPPPTASGRVLLRAGAVATFSQAVGTVTPEPSGGADRLLSWRFGFARFDEEPLYRVIGEINRYTDTKIVIEDKNILDMSVSGVFKMNDVEGALTAFELAFPIEVSFRFDRYVIVGRGDEVSPTDTDR